MREDECRNQGTSGRDTAQFGALISSVETNTECFGGNTIKIKQIILVDMSIFFLFFFCQFNGVLYRFLHFEKRRVL